MGIWGGRDTVQRCQCGFAACKGANVKTREGLGPGLGLEIREARRPRGSVEQRDPAIKGSSIRKPESHFQVSGLGRQVPGSGIRVSGTGSGPAPVPEPEDPHLIPDCRDLGPEDVLLVKGASGPPGLKLVSLHPLPTCQLVNRPASYPSGQLANRSTDQLCSASAEPMFPNHDHGGSIKFAIAHELAAHGFAHGLV